METSIAGTRTRCRLITIFISIIYVFFFVTSVIVYNRISNTGTPPLAILTGRRRVLCPCSRTAKRVPSKGGSGRPQKEFKRPVVILPAHGCSSNSTLVVPAWCLGLCAQKPEVELRMISRESCKSWTRSADGELYLCRFSKLVVSMYLSCHNDSLAKYTSPTGFTSL